MQMAKINKFATLFVASTLFFSNTPTFSASISGTKCSKLGTTKAISNIKYTCVKQGSKFLWNKGVAIKKPAAKPTPSSSPSPLPSSSSTPTPAPTKTPGSSISPTTETAKLPELTFENLEENQKFITQIAWQKLYESYIKNSSATSKFEIYIGPNTKTYGVDPSTVLANITRVIGNFPVPKLYRIIYYSRADLQWGIDKTSTLMGATEYQKSIDIHGGPLVKCNTPNDCNDGDAYVTPDGTAYVALGFLNNPNESTLSKYRKGEFEAVEIYHALQQNFYSINSSFMPSREHLRATNEPPFWLNIAGENLSMVMHTIPSNSIKDYQGMIDGNLQWAKQVYPDFNQKSISDYLNISNLNNYWSDFRCCTDNGRTGKMANMVGTPLLNILIALRGPSVFLTFHEEMALGKSFTKVFKEVFGVEYASVEPLFSRIIYAQFLQVT